MLGPLAEHDLPQAARLLAAEGWSFTPRELARRLALGRGLAMAAREGPDLLGLLTVARFGPLAWIGNVVVVPQARGEGLGEALVKEALRRCGAAGMSTVKLCSVPKAVSLYERLGFRAEGAMATWGKHHERPAHRPVEAEVLLPDDVPEVAALDARAFGADRTALLRALAEDFPDTGALVRAAGSIEGYAFLQPGGEGSVLGPLVVPAYDARVAALLLDAALGFRLEGAAAGLECTVPAQHPFLARLLEERGFEARHTTTLMAHGEPLAQDWGSCAALAGMEKG